MEKTGTCDAGPIRLGPREVQIWSIWLTASEAAFAYLGSTLTMEERQRAQPVQLRKTKTFLRPFSGGAADLACTLSRLSAERDRAHLWAEGQTGTSRLLPAPI